MLQEPCGRRELVAIAMLLYACERDRVAISESPGGEDCKAPH
jgi:hypothetical protein